MVAEGACGELADLAIRTLKDLMSLIGKLQHATKTPGRTCLCCMFEQKSSARRGQKFVRLKAHLEQT